MSSFNRVAPVAEVISACEDEDSNTLLCEETEEGLLPGCVPSFEFATGKNPKGRTCGLISSIACPECCCRRVGNMIVVCESKGKQGEHRIDCLCGPYWPVVTCFTFPAIIGVAILGAKQFWCCVPVFLRLLYVLFALVPILSLAYTAFADPGMLRRQSEQPDKSWRYSDQAETYRPPGSVYCTEAQAVIEDFDHVCPWTGNAIAKRNQHSFNVFLAGLIFFLLFMCFVMVWKDATYHPVYVYQQRTPAMHPKVYYNDGYNL